MLRGALLDGKNAGDLAGHLAFLAALSAVLLGLTALLLRVGERHAQRTGSLQLF